MTTPTCWKRVAALAIAMSGLIFGTLGCGDACAEAASLCEDCDVAPQDCEKAFENSTTEECESAVDLYDGADCG